MKELSIEEKARAYDKALARAKEQLNGAKVFDYDNEQVAHDIRTTAYNIFPELKESEDERIRKQIISFLKGFECDHYRCLDFSSWIAWLEKQGEQKPAEWHIEDEQNLNACLGYIPDELLRRWLKDVIHAKYDKHINKFEPTSDHWQDLRERAAIAAMQGYMSCKCQLVGTINLAMAEGIAEQAILIADALVERLKGE